MLDLIRKKLGYHVCEEFTQWEAHTTFHHYVRPSDLIEPNPNLVIDYVDRWQERRCTICGRIYQKELK